MSHADPASVPTQRVRRAAYPRHDPSAPPPRVRHAQGGGALGFFETTDDVSDLTSAALFQPGTRTEALVRFSGTLGHHGGPAAWRDVRGFAVKFFTDAGEYDVVGNNSPVFFLRDETAFASLVVAQKLFRDGGLYDYDRLWDFWTRHPETAHQVTWLLGDRGIPRSWRHQDGFGSHTFLWTAGDGTRHWIKYHLRSEQGHDFLSDAQADGTAEEEIGHRRRDLADAIAAGSAPTWTLSVQAMPYAAALTASINPFDVTKVWPHADWPPRPVGRLVLNRVPQDEVGQIEQAAFAPSSFVPGIGPSPDPMLIARIESYWTFHQHRVKAGAARPAAPPPTPIVADWDDEIAVLARHPRTDQDFVQPGELVRRVLDDDARDRLVATATAQLAEVRDGDVRSRAVAYWRAIDAGVGERIAAGLA